MDIAGRIAKYEDRGFTRERAEVNVLMEVAAFAIFRDFPDAFVLFGGATLVLYHDSRATFGRPRLIVPCVSAAVARTDSRFLGAGAHTVKPDHGDGLPSF